MHGTDDNAQTAMGLIQTKWTKFYVIRRRSASMPSKSRTVTVKLSVGDKNGRKLWLATLMRRRRPVTLVICIPGPVLSRVVICDDVFCQWKKRGSIAETISINDKQLQTKTHICLKLLESTEIWRRLCKNMTSDSCCRQVPPVWRTDPTSVNTRRPPYIRP